MKASPDTSPKKQIPSSSSMKRFGALFDFSRCLPLTLLSLTLFQAEHLDASPGSDEYTSSGGLSFSKKTIWDDPQLLSQFINASLGAELLELPGLKEEEEGDINGAKHAPRDEDYAVKFITEQKKFLSRLNKTMPSAQSKVNANSQFKSASSDAASPPPSFSTFGGLEGQWIPRGPYNQPGAWHMTEFDETDNTVWGMTCGHYGGNRWVFKGTLTGDDFKLISGNYPGRLDDMLFVPTNGGKRLLVLVNQGGIAYTDDDGQSWQESTGLLSGMTQFTVNRQDNNTIYATDKRRIYRSTDNGTSFSVLQDFGTSEDMSLYSPRYAVQPGNANVYLAREGEFYKLNSAKTSFDYRGGFTWPITNDRIGVGGDSQRLYVLAEKAWYASNDEGLSWNEMAAASSTGKSCKLGVHPEDPNIVVSGYLNAAYSHDGMATIIEPGKWGWHQVAPHPTRDIRHRVRLHADHQATQFFYDKDGNLFSIHSSDGGLYISYNDWIRATQEWELYTSDDIYYNITLYDCQTAEIYGKGMMTGALDPFHIQIGTQDQGTQTVEGVGNGTSLNFLQKPYGDGPKCISRDGLHGWKTRNGYLYKPFELYTGDIFVGRGNLSKDDPLTFGLGGSYQDYQIDHANPADTIWIRSISNLGKFHWNGTAFDSQVSQAPNSGRLQGFAQSPSVPSVLYLIASSKVYKSTDGAVSWNAGVATSISPLNICRMAVSPIDENVLLIYGESYNSVTSLFSDDGGSTFTDVTGTLPNVKVSDILATEDGEYFFASTDMGAFVFDVAQNQWSSLVNDTVPVLPGFEMNYIPAHGIVRFSTWGLGIWDFVINQEESGYATWAIANNLTAPDDASNADPDGDGYVNFLEYAFDSDPLTSDKPALPVVTYSGADLIYDFSNLRDGVNYAVYFSDDLSQWDLSSDPKYSADVTISSKQATITNVSWHGRLFMRLEVLE